MRFSVEVPGYTGAMPENDGAEICPQCNHPAKLNATRCPSCKRMYHEICLRQGCNCSKKASGTGSPDAMLVMGFGLGLMALGAGAWLRGARATGSELFMPAAALGGVGFLAACARKIDDPPAAANGHSAALLLFLPAIATVVVAAKGGEFPGFLVFFVVGALGAIIAVLGLATDSDRATSALAVLVAAQLYLANGVTLKADFGKRAFEQGKQVAAGKAKLMAPLGSTGAANEKEKAFRVSGVVNLGGTRKVMTTKGAFAQGDTIPDVGKIVLVTDDEVQLQEDGGALQHIPVPR